MTESAPMSRAPDAVRAAEIERIERFMGQRRFWSFAAPGLVLLYLIYAAVAFDVVGLAERARLDRAQILIGDMVSYKIVTTRDNRSGAVDVAIEGERASTFPTPPDWVAIGAEETLIDLEGGYTVAYRPDEILFTRPDYGVIRVTVSRANGVSAEFPDGGEKPDWVSLSRARLDLKAEDGGV